MIREGRNAERLCSILPKGGRCLVQNDATCQRRCGVTCWSRQSIIPIKDTSVHPKGLPCFYSPLASFAFVPDCAWIYSVVGWGVGK